MKIKIGKTTLIFICGACFLIIMAVLGMNYRTQAEEQSQLNGQIALTRQKIATIPIAQLTAREAALKAQLAATSTRIADIKASLDQSAGSIQVVKTLFEIADKNNLDIYNEQSSGLTNQNLEKVPFTAIPLKIQVRGSVPDIIDFVKQVTAKFPTSLIKPVQIDVPAPPPDTTISTTWSLEDGSLPEGLKLDPSTGAITGIPDADGTYDFLVKADFSDGTSEIQDLSITIDPHSITTGSLTDGEVNMPYSQKLDATGGVPSISNVPPDKTTPTASITMNILSYGGN